MADKTIERSQVLAHRRSPAHDLGEAMERGSGEGVRLREVPFLTQVALRAEITSAAGAALEGALGTPLPRSVGEVTHGPDEIAVLWLAPDEFLAIGPDEADGGPPPSELTDRLVRALGTSRGQAVEVSANRTTFELSGPAAQAVLEKSVRLDLHPREFAPGTALLTHLGTTPTLLWRTAPDAWRVLVRSSFAMHAGAWLLDGMREFV